MCAASDQEEFPMVTLIESAIQTTDLKQFAQNVFPHLTEATAAEGVFAYLSDNRLPTPRFYPYQIPADTRSKIEELYAAKPSGEGTVIKVNGKEILSFPLQSGGGQFGSLGLFAAQNRPADTFAMWDRSLNLLSHILDDKIEREKINRQLKHQNSYLTISSMLSQSLGLYEMLEAALYCSMDAISADAGSVLLLDENKENFHFYQVGGPAKPVLMTATFPADKGIAGHVLKANQSEVINNVQKDPRFYKVFDSETGFLTRNMIVLPLVAGEEQVGVLELLNKADGADFTEEERLSLELIAEEIAFAIRNAMVFEYVANTYCIVRQGETSCAGCKRPLGTWTPCVRYESVTVMRKKK
jgi:hypothetical protein